MPKTIQQEIDEAIKKLKSLPKEFSKKEKRKVLRKAAKPLIEAARNNIPRSSKPHYRYKTSKASQSIKAPKGKGKIVATYYPGNLRRSIRAMTFRKSSDIFVGPRVARRGKGGRTFKGRRVDGFYANQMEFGNKNHAGFAYMRKAIPTATSKVQSIIIREAKKTVEDFAKKNKI